MHVRVCIKRSAKTYKNCATHENRSGKNIFSGCDPVSFREFSAHCWRFSPAFWAHPIRFCSSETATQDIAPAHFGRLYPNLCPENRAQKTVPTFLRRSSLLCACGCAGGASLTGLAGGGCDEKYGCWRASSALSRAAGSSCIRPDNRSSRGASQHPGNMACEGKKNTHNNQGSTFSAGDQISGGCRARCVARNKKTQLTQDLLRTRGPAQHTRVTHTFASTL